MWWVRASLKQTGSVLLKYGKLAVKYPWIYGYFYSVLVRGEIDRLSGTCHVLWLDHNSSVCKYFQNVALHRRGWLFAHVIHRFYSFKNI